MYLKELQLFGFKSFPEKTSLKFEPGTTVVVGPNGCGKSNILDSIKWALGEQSPKSLRGSKMEDIIFNGTENHSPLNYTEVTLTFSNESNYLPIDYKEVSVSRRLYRSGESNYFINKNMVRLKDIQTLFMGTGIGESTYSFVEQGKIEIFLSYKPEDKRLIFDEASGIVKYKERKREALRRLQETAENLLRLEDILSEVRRQIRYLERQVSKAKRYKQVRERLAAVEKEIAAHKFAQLEEKNKQFLEEAARLQVQAAAREGELVRFQEEEEQISRRLKGLRDELSAANELVVSLRAQIDGFQNHLLLYEQRIKEFSGRNASIEQTKGDLGQRLALAQDRSRTESARLAELEESLSAADRQVKELTALKESIEKEIKDANDKIKEDKGVILAAESKRVHFANQLIEIQTNLSALVKRKNRLFLDKARAQQLCKEKKSSFDRAQQELEASESRLAVLKEHRSSLALKQEELEGLKEKLTVQRVDKEKEMVELKSCYEFLKDLRTKYDTFSVKKRITVVFDEEPRDINKMVLSLKGVAFEKEGRLYKTQIEAKVVSLEEGQLEEKMAAAEQDIRRFTQELAQLEGERNKISRAVSVENQQIEKEEGTRQVKLQERDGLEGDFLRLREEVELVEEEVKTTNEETDNLGQRQKEIEAEVSSYEERLDAARRNLAGCQEIVAAASGRLKDTDIEIARKQEQQQSFVKEKEALNSKLALFEEEKANILNNLQRIEAEKVENEQRVDSFKKEIDNLKAKIEQGQAQVTQHIRQKQALEKQEEGLCREAEEKKAAIAAGQRDLAQVKSSRHDNQLRIQGLDYEKEKICDYLRQVYHIEFDPAGVESSGMSPAALEEEKERIDKRIKSLGEVNLIAIEEFEELKKRQEFLEKQKEDLVLSQENLKKAIQKINRTCKELFLETFTKIQEEFKKNFRFLFNGGRARLILLDQDNILESGVEIEVQPPGKKLQNVSLLSGGEKALTAIALVFAIFRVRPSPLCVLDEIDAPLDEANVDRFNNLLREFSSIAQFILITHNKKTMSNSDALYGVTMQEKGVSKVVSVKFAAQEHDQEEAEVPA